MSSNPYAAPRASVGDLPIATDDSDFIPTGRAVDAGNGLNWIGQGWELFMKQPGMWILIAFILGLLFFFPFVSSISGLLYPLFNAGLMIGCRALEQDEPLEVSHVFAGFNNYAGRLLLVTLFMFVAVLGIGALTFALIGISVGLGASLNMPGEAGVLLIVLGILIVIALMIPVYMATWFAPALIVLNDYSIGRALKTSFRACLINVLPFLLWSIVIAVLFVIGSIPLLLGLLVVVPVTIASAYASYRDIFYLD